MLTILGEFVLPNDEAAWTQTLIAAMELVGVKDKAARQAIARMRERDWLTRTRVGRQTRWELTPSARRLLEAGAQRIYGFGQASREWDGTWLILLASVPERDRNIRYRMGVELSWAGFGSLGHGTWLSPWPDQEELAVSVLDSLGVDAISFRAELGRLGTTEQLATEAWDLPRVRSQYDEFLAETDRLAAGVGTDGMAGADAAARLIGLVHQWRRVPFLDPELPLALLPDDWPGLRAAARFAELRAWLSPPATAWWRTTEARHTPGR